MHTTPTGDVHATKLGTLVNFDRIRSSSAFLKDPTAPIVEIKYHFKSDGHFVNPRRTYKSKRAMTPAEITAKTATGEKIRLKLY